MRSPCSIALAAVVLVGCSAPSEPAPSAPSDTSQSFVLSDVQADLLHRFDAFSGARLDPNEAWDALEGPAGLTSSSDGDWLWVTSFETHEVMRFGSPHGGLADVIYLDRAVLEEPVAVLEVDDGLLVLGNDTDNVVRLDAQGEVVMSFGGGHLAEPHDMTLGPDGLLYVANAAWRPQLGLIQVFDLDTGERVREFARPDVLMDAVGLEFDADGTLLVADWFGSRLLRFDPNSGQLLEVVADSSDGLDRPLDLAVRDDGALLLIDRTDVVVVDGGVSLLVDGDANGLRWARALHLLR
ncbi:MAG: hypothetical protein KDA24_26995 [Deltaproteobacteria bacterium]|nr:hypothetical protein [Deltaproteobacteria bacterium]